MISDHVDGSLRRPTLIIYGANGHSGRLIVNEAFAVARSKFRLVAAGRNPAAVAAVAHPCPGVQARTLDLADSAALARGISDASVVLNTAGPFDDTALPLMTACMHLGIHYVDINGEFDVHQRLQAARSQGAGLDATVASGAGYTGGVVALLLSAALSTLLTNPAIRERRRLGAVRACFSRIPSLSRGSVATGLRMLSQPVIVGEARRVSEPTGRGAWVSALTTVPVGTLERKFEFRSASSDEPARRQPIAAAASLIDTLMMRATLQAAEVWSDRIESYVEMSGWQRLAYQVGALAAPLAATSRLAARAEAMKPYANLAVDESPVDMSHSILLEIDSAFAEPLIRWQFDTSSVYALTAELAVSTAAAVCDPAWQRRPWCTPSQILSESAGDALAALRRLRSGQVRQA